MLCDRAIEIDIGLTQQAGVELADEDVKLAPGGQPRTPTGPCEAVPGLGEREECGTPAGLVRRQHRAHATLAVDVGAHDDPLAALDRLEHRLARGYGQAVDRETQLLQEPGAVMRSICHRLWSARVRLRCGRMCAQP